jgi:signal transduction histidine kinase
MLLLKKIASGFFSFRHKPPRIHTLREPIAQFNPSKWTFYHFFRRGFFILRKHIVSMLPAPYVGKLLLTLIICLALAVSLLAQPLVYPFGPTRQVELPAAVVASGQTYEHRFVVQNPGSQPAPMVVEVGNAADSIRLYQERGNTLVLLDHTGQLTATRPRPSGPMPYLRDKNLVLFTLGPGQSVTYRLQLTNRMRLYPRTFPVRLFTPAAYQANEALWLYHSEHRQRVGSAFFWGIIMMMFLFTSAQFFLLRERMFLYYALYLLLVLVRLLMLDEFIVVDTWPVFREIGFTGRVSLTTFFWSLSAYTLFLRTYIQLDTRAPRLDRVYRWTGWILFGLGAFDFFITMKRLYIPALFSTYSILEISLLTFGLFTLWVLWRFYDSTVKFLFWGTVFVLTGGLISFINQQVFYDVPGLDFREVLIWATSYIAELLAFSLGLAKRQQLVMQDKLQTQTALVEQLQENQRKQAQLLQIRGDIARDLHDELGSELSGISILSQVAIGRLAHQPAQAQTALTTIGETARHIMDRMRDIVWSLTLQEPQSDAVASRLRNMAGSLFEHTGIRPVLEIPAQLPVPTLSPDQWRNLSLIYKEALHNVVKHARATEVSIRLLAEDPHTFCLTIEDNGTGFSPDALPMGNGLRNQHHRATALGGTVHVDSGPGQGTRVVLRFPNSQNTPPRVNPRPNFLNLAD